MDFAPTVRQGVFVFLDHAVLRGTLDLAVQVVLSVVYLDHVLVAAVVQLPVMFLVDLDLQIERKRGAFVSRDIETNSQIMHIFDAGMHILRSAT